MANEQSNESPVSPSRDLIVVNQQGCSGNNGWKEKRSRHEDPYQPPKSASISDNVKGRHRPQRQGDE